MARRLEVVIVGDAAALERAFGKAEAATSGFGGAMAAAGTRLDAIGGRMQTAGKKMTEFVTLPILGVGVAAAKMAMDAQVSTARLDQAFTAAGLSAGKYAGQIDKAEAAGRQLGFTNTETKNALGSLIIATGDTGKAITDLSVAYDISRFKHIGLTDASKMLTMAMTGSQRAIKQLGLIVTPVTANLDALKASHVDLTTASGKLEEAHAKLLDKMATGQAIIAAVTDKVKGQADAFSQTAAGGMARFRAQLDSLGEKLGTVILPIINKLVDYLDRALQWFDKLSPGMKRTIEIAALVAAAIGPVVAVMGSLVTAIGAVATAIAFLAANPIVLLAAAVVAVGAAIAAAVLFPQQFQAVLEKMGLSATSAATVVGDLQAAFQAIKTVVEAVWPVIQTVIVTVLDQLKNYFQLFDDLLHGRWSKLWGDLERIVTTAWQGIVKTVKAYLELVWSVASGALTKLAGLFASVWRAITSTVTGAMAAVRSGAISAFNAIVNGIGGLAGAALAAAGRFGRAIYNGITGALSGLAGALERLITYPINKIIDGINAIKIPGWGGFSIGSVKVAGVTVFPGATIPGFPSIDPIPGNIPHFALGGLVTKPTLAVVGEKGPEAVIPLRLLKALTGTGARTITIHNHNQVMPADPHLWARQVAFDLKAAG